jgi:hypothetical protein
MRSVRLRHAPRRVLSRPRRFVGLAAAALGTLVTVACGTTTPPETPEQKGARATANAYLEAWEKRDYRSMCRRLSRCDVSEWPDDMDDFPVPVRDPDVGTVRSDGSHLKYTIEMPDLGSVTCAAIDESPRTAARLLNFTGEYVEWDDTLRLVERDGHWLIEKGDSGKGSNGLVRWMLAMGAFVRTAEIVEPPDPLPSALALYAVELGVSQEEIGEKAREVIDQCEAYRERVRRRP